MQISFENYGEFYPALVLDDGVYSYYNYRKSYSLAEVSDWIEYRMKRDIDIIKAHICDYHTGEIVATITRD